MVTRLYFHAALSGLSNLPTAEQSSLTSNKDADAQTVNRSMDKTIGTSQASIVLATNATGSAQNYYFTCFVSKQLLGITSISAQTWTYNIAASQSNTSARFPVVGISKSIRVMAYVWRPGTGKVGDILDGNTAATISDSPASTNEKCRTATFTGAAVAGVQNNDVIVFEVWFQITQGAAVSYNDTIYFDGATVTTTDYTSVTDHASFIETPQDLVFVGEVVTVTSVDTAKYKIRQLATNQDTHKYKIRQLATNLDTIKYKIRIKTGLKVNILKYKIRTKTGLKVNILRYKIRQVATNVDTIRYKIRQLATNIDTIRYKIRKLATSVDILRYKIRVKTGLKVNILKYKIRTKTGLKVNTLKYKIRQVATNVDTIRYKIRQLATNVDTLRYDLRTKTGLKVNTLRYKIKIKTGLKVNTLRYKIRQVATNVDTLRYKIRQVATNQDILRYKIKRLVTNVETFRYDLRLKTGLSVRTYRYKIKIKTGQKTNTLSYKIRQVATNVDTIRYKIRQLVTNQDTLKYKIRKLTGNSVRILRYKIRVKTGLKVNTLRYKIRVKTGLKVNTLRYKIRQVATNIDTLKYNLKQIVRAYPYIQLPSTTAVVNMGSDTGLWSLAKSKFSFSLWIKPSIFSTGNYQYLVNHGWQAIGSFVLYLNNVSSAIVISVRDSVSGKSTSFVLPTNLLNNWIHVSCTFDNSLVTSDVKLYINGVKQGTVSGDVTETLGYVGSLTIGAGATSMQDGAVKDFKWFTNKALTAQEALDLYTNSGSPPTPDYWLKLSEGFGNPKDSISGTKTATLTNTIWSGGQFHGYDIRLLTGISTRIYRYKVRQLATNLDSIRYKIRQLATNQDILRYKIKTLVTSIDILKYKIRVKTGLSARIYRYKIRKVTGLKTNSLRYNIRIKTGLKVNILRYKIRQIASNSDTLRYKVRQLATNLDSIRYKIRAKTGLKVNTLRYKIRTKTGPKILTSRYKIRQIATHAYRFIYDIIVVGIVNKQVRFIYKVRQTSTNQDTLKYNIRKVVRAYPRVQFDGVNDYLDCKNDATLWSQPLTKFSFSLWVYAQAQGGTRYVLVHGSGAQSFLCYQPASTTDRFTFRIVDAAVANHDSFVNVGNSILNRWVHIVGVYDSTLGSANVKIYADTIQGGTTNNLTETINQSAAIFLASSSADFQGYMKDLRWFTNKALTPSEIADIYNNSVSAPVPNYWLKMDEGIGNPVDSISGTKTATLTNGASWGSGLTHSYKIRQLTGQSSRVLRYKIRQLANNVNILRYKIRKLATSVNIVRYKIRKLATSQNILRYKIRILTKNIDTLRYKIRGLTGNKVNTLRYKIRIKTGLKTNTLRYKLRQIVKAYTSVLFDGIDDSITIPNIGAINNLEDFTITMWVFPTSLGSSTPHLFIKGYPAAHGIIAFFAGTGNYTINYRVLNNAAGFQQSSATQINTGGIRKWYHVVCTFKRSTQLQQIFVDKVLADSDTVPGTVDPNVVGTVANMSINGGGGAAKWGGNVRDFRLYRSVLSQADIDKVYANDPSVSVSPDYWLKMDEGIGNPKNAINPLNVGTLVNGATWAAGQYQGYKIKILTGLATRIQRYKIRTLAEREEIFRYDIRVLARVQNRFVYGIHTLTRVSKNMSYRILTLVGQTRTDIYNIRQRVSSTVISKYKIKAFAISAGKKAGRIGFTVKEGIPRTTSFLRGLYDRTTNL